MVRRFRIWLLAGTLACAPCAGTGGARAADGAAPVVRVAAAREHAHDPEAFTQGLLLDESGEQLYESSGLYGRSWIGRAPFPPGGAKGARVRLPARIFAEGCALAGEELILLSWREGAAFALDRQLRLLRSMPFRGEGWGLAWDGEHLWRSDGSSVLVRHDPRSFAETGRLAVTDGGRPVSLLNELEWVDGWLYANIWKTDEIVVIDPQSGAVTQRLDCGELAQRARSLRGGRDAEACLNGIAWRKGADTLLLAGKLWPVLFEVERPPVRPTERKQEKK